MYISNFPHYVPDFPDGETVYREFTFRPAVKRSAEKCLHLVKKLSRLDENTVFVGIHNRRTDYEGRLPFVSPEFFKVSF